MTVLCIDDIEPAAVTQQVVADPVSFRPLKPKPPPPSTRKKLALKPKPKLRSFHPQQQITVRNATESGFNPKSSSLPRLDSVSKATANEDADEDEDYIEPSYFEQDDDGIYTGEQRNSKLLTKANSVPYITHRPENSIFPEAKLRKLLPNTLQDWQDVREVCHGDSGDITQPDYKPLYDAIKQDTLLSRMGQPKLDDSSSCSDYDEIEY